jgi:hypothetical protein
MFGQSLASINPEGAEEVESRVNGLIETCSAWAMVTMKNSTATTAANPKTTKGDRVFIAPVSR